MYTENILLILPSDMNILKSIKNIFQNMKTFRDYVPIISECNELINCEANYLSRAIN